MEEEHSMTTTSSVQPPTRIGRPTAVLAAMVGLAILAGCNTKAPKYSRPETPTKSAWSSQVDGRSIAQQAIDPEWWRGFKDPTLDILVAKALEGNTDLRVLAARIGVAKASIDQASARAKPTILGGAGVDITKHTQVPGTSTQISLATTMDWELDIWGKFAKGVEAQEAEVQASEADWRAGYLTLVSDVATAYFQIRQLDGQLAQQSAALKQNQRIARIYERRYQEGLIPRTLLLQQRAEVNRLKQAELEIQRLRTVTENGLATLLGLPAGDYQIAPGDLMSNVAILDVPEGIPSDLLNRRPDIVAAEYRAVSAVKLVGQARLAQLPSIGLTARGGTASNALNTLLKAWTFGLSPSISLPMFDPNVKAQIRVSEAEVKVAEEQYRGTVMRAFEEVENALVTLDSRKQQRIELKERVDRLREVNKQTRAQLQAGIISQLEVFESERSILGAEQELLANYQEILSGTISLYKALGGGWPPVLISARLGP
jgi:NodT family efflux transporter outer membrane factor (OMF) lipoprotein